MVTPELVITPPKVKHLEVTIDNNRVTIVGDVNHLILTDEVARLLRDHQQNRELLGRLGKRFFQVVYPIQVKTDILTLYVIFCPFYLTYPLY